MFPENGADVHFGAPAEMQLGVKTVAYWVKYRRPALGHLAFDQVVIGWNNSSWACAFRSLYMRTRWTDDLGAVRTYDNTDGRLLSGVWSFVAHTFNIVAGDTVITNYVHSTQIGPQSTLAGRTFTAGPFDDFYIGRRAGAGSFGSYSLSGAFVVARAMTPAELQEVERGFTKVVDIPNIVSYWPMDDGHPTTLTDVVSGVNGTFGTLGTSPTWGPDVPQTRRQAGAGP